MSLKLKTAPRSKIASKPKTASKSKTALKRTTAETFAVTIAKLEATATDNAVKTTPGHGVGVNPLQGSVAIMFRQLATLDSFGKIAFDR